MNKLGPFQILELLYQVLPGYLTKPCSPPSYSQCFSGYFRCESPPRGQFPRSPGGDVVKLNAKGGRPGVTRFGPAPKCEHSGIAQPFFLRIEVAGPQVIK